ncbi:tRNA (adenosine(37)-N6)-threonylcarbamoyltransferase complex ATPase subunit type 1 TsaE [Candidatus Uhrbacteria bacterium]|nr:tRNA (adenosine(37)-N6)-threonylcarbamoyltransferase complex ATPase subunit type 1 TsaE [Candidatus Uhrbacteria bacterium]
MKTTAIENLEAMRAFAKDFARSLKGGEIIGLVGDLGAGKTTLVQMLAAALGAKTKVHSPTFVLMRSIPVKGGKMGEIRSILHADAYRIESEKEMIDAGFWELAGKHDTVALIEWADRMPSIHRLPNYRELTIRLIKGGSREIDA